MGGQWLPERHDGWRNWNEGWLDDPLRPLRHPRRASKVDGENSGKRRDTGEQ